MEIPAVYAAFSKQAEIQAPEIPGANNIPQYKTPGFDARRLMPQKYWVT